jgi:hypothetical protein
VSTVTSEVMPTIQPVQRSVAASSRALRRWMWNGRLTKTNDQAKLAKKVATGTSRGLRAIGVPVSRPRPRVSGRAGAASI